MTQSGITHGEEEVRGTNQTAGPGQHDAAAEGYLAAIQSITIQDGSRVWESLTEIVPSGLLV